MSALARAATIPLPTARSHRWAVAGVGAFIAVALLGRYGLTGKGLIYAFVALVRQYQPALLRLAEEMRRRKSEVFAALVSELQALDKRYGVRSALADELAVEPNNARLASLATYYECVPGFRRVLEEQQRDLPRFYDAVRGLAKLSPAERHAQLCPAAPVAP